MSAAALYAPVHAPRACWQAARRILCVRLDALGDVLMTTPALRALKHSSQQRRLTLLCSPAGAAMLPYLPELDDAIEYDAPWMKHALEPDSARTRHLIERLRASAFDAAVIFTVYSQSALPAAMLCWQAGIPLRLAHSRENPYHVLTDWEPESEPQTQLRHETRRQLDLVASVGCAIEDEHLSFRLDPRESATALEKLRARGIGGDGNWIVVHPGATAASRRYPAEMFAAAVRKLAEQTGHSILVTGSESEEALVRSVVDRTPNVHEFAGVFSLGELAAVIGRAALIVANNTGPAHLAAALGTPVVDLYALTNPQHTPWRVPHRVLFEDVPCRFCYRSVCAEGHHRCLRGVPPSMVAAAAQELLRADTRHTPAPQLLPQD